MLQPEPVAGQQQASPGRLPAAAASVAYVEVVDVSAAAAAVVVASVAAVAPKEGKAESVVRTIGPVAYEEEVTALLKMKAADAEALLEEAKECRDTVIKDLEEGSTRHSAADASNCETTAPMLALTCANSCGQ